MEKSKSFGLVLPKKGEGPVKRKSIFDSDSDDEKDKQKTSQQTVKGKYSKICFSKPSSVKQEQIEDPSIYEYDSIYDDMKTKQKESIPKPKNSRYIDSLLKAADKRKKEYERRIERKIQVEREQEGDKFKDKEAFVTSSYKKKMEELEEEERRERIKNQLDDMMDVTKQKDLSGFYRHFLKQAVGEEKVLDANEDLKRVAFPEEKTVAPESPHRDSDEASSDDSSSSSSDDNSNSSNSEEKECAVSQPKHKSKPHLHEHMSETLDEEADVAVNEKPNEAVKIDIFAKRTVGRVFDDAQARYFQRMSARVKVN